MAEAEVIDGGDDVVVVKGEAELTRFAVAVNRSDLPLSGFSHK